MTTKRTAGGLLAASLLALGLTACHDQTYINDGNGHSVELHDDILTAHAHGVPDAVIDAAGDLTIGDKKIALTPAQRSAAKSYHDSLIAVRTAGIQTGQAGAKVAVHAAGDAITDVLRGDANKASSKIEQRAREVQVKALAICDRLDAAQTAQDRLAIAIPAFKPYAAMQVKADANCRRDAMRDH